MIQLVGSFTTVWMLLWLSLTLMLLLIYPLVRQVLFKLRSAYAGNLLLSVIAIPMLLSLLSATLLFSPPMENVLVQDHCHDNCGQHVPVFDSPFLAWPGLLVFGAIVIFFGLRLWQQLRFAKKLNAQLRLLSEPNTHDGYFLLVDQQPLVFTVGWWRNSSYLSEGIQSACTDRELAIIKAHEQAHIERKDNLRVMAARLLMLLLPAPLAGKILADLQLLIESACDAQAAREFGKLEVAETFVKIQRLMPTLANLPYGVAAINGSPIEQRVETLLVFDELHQPAKWVTWMGVCGLLAGIVLVINPLHHLIEIVLGVH